MTTCAVIPFYNHPHTITTLVSTLRRQGLAVIIVDDGSDASCAPVLAALQAGDQAVSVIHLPANRGKGAAVVAGARTALQRGFTHMLQIDADGQHDTSAVTPALHMARAHPRAMVIGIPVFDDSIPRARFYGRWLTHALVWVQTWSLAIRDAMCGFRIYPLAPFVALADRHPIAARMGFDIDVAVRLVWDAVPVRQVDVAVRYPQDGISHFDMWHDNLRIVLLHLRLLGGMLLRTPTLARRRLRALHSSMRHSDQ